MSLSKRFIKHLKLTLTEDRQIPSLFEKPEESDIDSDDVKMEDEGESQKESLYRFVGH